jgi:integrase
MSRVKYLHRRKGSQNWYVKLWSPDGYVEKSLRTPDRHEAELAAADYVKEHKRKLLEARPRLVPGWHHQYEPGLHEAPNGERVAATDRELTFYDAAGKFLRTEPNGQAVPTLINWPMGMVLTMGKPTPQQRRIGPVVDLSKLARPPLAAKNSDDAVIETYIRHAGVTGYFEREARATWTLYKTLTNNKPLKGATRDDGRKIVAHFEAQGVKTATTRKKIGWLAAAVNLAIKEGKLRFNPFAGIVPKREDNEARLPLSDADMKAVKGALGRLSEGDRLLLRLLASTGMRLSEAFEIGSEAVERGCRYTVVGHKTAQSKRRVPFPAAVLPYLPKTIRGPLFRGSAPAASKRLNRFLKDAGISDARKVVHSFRHRAKDRLRAAGCPLDVQYELLGHETKTVASGYGRGSPVPLLKRWIDKIGF